MVGGEPADGPGGKVGQHGVETSTADEPPSTLKTKKCQHKRNRNHRTPVPKDFQVIFTRCLAGVCLHLLVQFLGPRPPARRSCRNFPSNSPLRSGDPSAKPAVPLVKRIDSIYLEFGVLGSQDHRSKADIIIYIYKKNHVGLATF